MPESHNNSVFPLWLINISLPLVTAQTQGDKAQGGYILLSHREEIFYSFLLN